MDQIIVIILENLIEIVGAAVLTGIAVFGAWLTARIGKNEKLKSINTAQQEVVEMAQQTVEEIQQTLVDGMKASHEDGKLTEAEIKALGQTLVEKVTAKMSQPTYDLLDAAGVDIVALIKGAGEAWIQRIKNFE